MSRKRALLRRLKGAGRRLGAAWRVLTDPFARLAYSQEGEDLILERLFEKHVQGFYVDVGAHHPTRFSNTYIFYLKGWSGLNIDAAPGSMKAFQKVRPRDTNIEVAVAGKQQSLSFHIYNDEALNSAIPPEARGIDRSHHQLVRKVDVPARPLAEILAEKLPDEQHIDFLTIDVEGMDLQVLGSNDWKRFRPTYVLAEEVRGIGDETSIMKYMNAQHYSLYCRTMNTIFFLDDLARPNA